jgi:SNF2 family DNA or RNA helicase
MSTKKSYISSMSHIYKRKPLEHQREALNISWDKKYFLYLMGMGTGKTKVAIDNAVFLFNQKEINSVFIIAPNSITHNWLTEIDADSSAKGFKYLYRRDSFDFHLKDHINWYIMNVEALSHASGVKAAKKVIDKHGDKMLMVVDECTTIKNHKAKRTKNIIKLAKDVKYKRGMTGSPTTKSPLDLYSQCEFLKDGLLGFTSYYSFRARYALMRPLTREGFRQTMIPYDYQNLAELFDKVKPFSYRKIKEECLNLPPKIHTRRELTMSPQQLEIYNQLKKYARAVLMDKKTSYTNKLTEILRLHQVTCGFFKSDTGEIETLNNPKIKELINILDEIDGKVIIWANYVHNIENIIKTLKEKFPYDKTVSVYGAVSVVDRDKAVNDFQKDPYTKFLVGNPSTGGYGLNLTEATTVIYYSNSYDLTVREQSEDRAHRKGQSKNVTYIDLVVKGTIDEFILKALNNKKRMSAQVLGEEVLNFL